MMTHDRFIVTEGAAGQRFDVWAASFKGISRSQAQKEIKNGIYSVNGRKVSSHYVLKIGEEIEFSGQAVPAISTVPQIKKPSLLPAVEIISETTDYIVLNKPAGLLMHPAHDEFEVSLVDWLLKKFPKISKVGEDPLRPGIVHRLDREVSGLVVIAKTQAMFDLLKEQFQKRTIAKYYRSLVHGGKLPTEGEINFRIERSTQGYKMAAKPLNQSGKSAVTLFEVERCWHNYTLLRLRIKTGRTHQIRAHLAAYGHPVAGDDLYATPRFKALNKKLHLGRIFLVAVELAFLDRKGERQVFEIPLPAELEAVLATLT